MCTEPCRHISDIKYSTGTPCVPNSLIYWVDMEIRLNVICVLLNPISGFCVMDYLALLFAFLPKERYKASDQHMATYLHYYKLYAEIALKISMFKCVCVCCNSGLSCNKCFSCTSHAGESRPKLLSAGWAWPGFFVDVLLGVTVSLTTGGGGLGRLLCCYCFMWVFTISFLAHYLIVTNN